jgi:hypothetical protein
MTFVSNERLRTEDLQAEDNQRRRVDEGPLRRTIASFSTYREAQTAVDRLSDARFAVERVAIVAEGLQYVEQVTGRLNWWVAMLNGALSGAFTGFLLGFFLAMFSLVTPIVSTLTVALYALLIGAGVGAILGLIYYAFTGGRRDFVSVGSVRAERYNIMVDTEVADEAARILEQPRA